MAANSDGRDLNAPELAKLSLPADQAWPLSFREQLERDLDALRQCALCEVERLTAAVDSLEADMRAMATGAGSGTGKPLSPRASSSDRAAFLLNPRDVQPALPAENGFKVEICEARTSLSKKQVSLGGSEVVGAGTMPPSFSLRRDGSTNSFAPAPTLEDEDMIMCPTETNGYDGCESQGSKFVRNGLSGVSGVSGVSDGGCFYKAAAVWTTATPELAAFHFRRKTQGGGPGRSRNSMLNRLNSNSSVAPFGEQRGVPSTWKSWLYGLWERMMAHPYGWSCVAWDLCFMILIFYEVITIPLQLFDPPENLFADVMVWLSRIYWSVAIPRSLCTGFVRYDGRVVMSPKKVAKNYVHTWFLFDVLIVLIDWAEAALKGTEIIQSLRLFRLTRTLRVLKVMKLTAGVKQPEWLQEAFLSDSVLLLVTTCFKTVCGLMCLSHFMGCFWYGLGWEGMRQGQPNWLNKEDIEGKAFAVRYLHSLYWAVAHLAWLEVTPPQNELERAWSAMTLLGTYILMVGLVSKLTGILVDLSVTSGYSSMNFPLLRRYLKQHGISTDLSQRVTQAARYAIAQRYAHLPETEVRLLNIISGPLLTEIRYEVYGQFLITHPFFREYSKADLVGLQSLCRYAVSELMLHSHDTLFVEGEVPRTKRMLLVKSGDLVYNSMSLQKFRHLEEGAWVSEMVLWVENWLHLGSLTVNYFCTAVALDALAFQQTVLSFSSTSLYARRYCQMLIAKLTDISSSTVGSAAPVDDVDTIGLDVSEIADAAFSIAR
eukprot:TRINITY_DN25008_c0_g2_i1.p1 TRINITY_DN25008_c0_g2~~TRINITY_DN25008_c0_g2_i1.p1  ORF type:complete len:769 (-),score=147.75 TRINITY_DN25008_c0_g2_i1:210-2516(-)